MLINMKHDKDGEYVYASGVEGPIIEVQVRYSLGGQSFLSGGTNPRGIYIHVTPVTLERHNGYVSRCYSLFGNLIRSGTKILAMELKRKSDKHLLAVAEIVDSMAPAIASLWITDQAADCCRMPSRP